MFSYFRAGVLVLLFGTGSVVHGSESAPSLKATFRVCAAQLPDSLKGYAVEVISRYKGIHCHLGDRDKALVDSRGNAVIVFASDRESRDPVIIAHELMHLWLGTKGWNLSERFMLPRVLAEPEGGEQAVEDSFAAIENYIEHRMFVPILHNAGISDRGRQLSALQEEEVREANGAPAPPVLLGAIYLEMRLGDRQTGDLFAEFLRKTGRERALEAADVLNAIINADDPRSQTEAFWAEQDCFNRVFALGSSFLNLTP